jgi:transcriptional regulator with XRE-family HTH domain
MPENSIAAGGFGGRLRRLREQKGISPYRLAQLTGLSEQGALNLEEPGADPKLSTIVRLAGALGVPPWELLPGWPTSTAVDQGGAKVASTQVGQAPAPAVAPPADPPGWVCTERDTERCLKAVWSRVRGARDSAHEGDWGEATAALKYLLEYLDGVPPVRVCPWYWYGLWEQIEPVMRRAIGVLQGDRAKRVARSGKVTGPMHQEIDAVFAGMDACFFPLAEPWVGDWENESEAEAGEQEVKTRRDDEAE